LTHVVKRVLAGQFFHQPPPRSTDGPQMIEAFRDGFDGALGDHKLPTLLATAGMVTVGSILMEIEKLPKAPDEVIVSGGGAKNQFIMRSLMLTLPKSKLMRTDDFGIKGDSKEALAFAMLGAATLDNTPANVISATGARRAVVLGSITPKP
jgi:anhydro-N-acetylmuramic acid kinase